MATPTISIRQLHELLNLPESRDERLFSRVSAFEEADPNSIVFAEDEPALEKALASAAGLILAPPTTSSERDSRVLAVQHPKHAFALCGQWLDRFAPAVIHPSAVIDPTATVGSGTSVGAGCVVQAGAVIGEFCSIAANVTIYGNTVVGDRVVVQAGAVLGAMGFGYVRGEDGRYTRFPQQGRLLIEDDVEIGANTTIDRGALGETRIGRGTKIDNLVHIGHNCTIGRDVIIAAQVGISGSCVVEDGAILAGQVGISDHCHIGAGVILGGQAGVFRGKAVTGPGQAFAGTPAEPIGDYLKSIAKLRRLRLER